MVVYCCHIEKESLKIMSPEAEFKEFEPQRKFQPWLKYGWLKIVFNFSRFKPALNWNRFLADLSCCSNSLSSDTVSFSVTTGSHVSINVISLFVDHDEEKIPKQEYKIAKPVFTENTQETKPNQTNTIWKLTIQSVFQH